MRIDNRFQQPAADRTKAPPSSAAEARRPEGATKNVQQPQVYLPTAELQAVLKGVQQQPEVRTEVLKRVSQRLEQGEYLTQDAAEQTAAAILAQR